MKKNCVFVCISFLLMLIFSNCNIERDDFTGLDINPEMVNSRICLEEFSGFDGYFNDNLSPVNLFSLSDTPIIFSGDYGLYIFTHSETGWREIDNNVYYSTDELVLLPTAEDPVGFVIGIVPHIPGLEEAAEIRVVVHGTDTSSNEEVAAYIDLTLQP